MTSWAAVTWCLCRFGGLAFLTNGVLWHADGTAFFCLSGRNGRSTFITCHSFILVLFEIKLMARWAAVTWCLGGFIRLAFLTNRVLWVTNGAALFHLSRRNGRSTPITSHSFTLLHFVIEFMTSRTPVAWFLDRPAFLTNRVLWHADGTAPLFLARRNGISTLITHHSYALLLLHNELMAIRAAVKKFQR